jgi:hypothetical protein
MNEMPVGPRRLLGLFASFFSVAHSLAPEQIQASSSPTDNGTLCTGSRAGIRVVRLLQRRDHSGSMIAYRVSTAELRRRPDRAEIVGRLENANRDAPLPVTDATFRASVGVASRIFDGVAAAGVVAHACREIGSRTTSPSL